MKEYRTVDGLKIKEEQLALAFIKAEKMEDMYEAFKETMLSPPSDEDLEDE